MKRRFQYRAWIVVSGVLLVLILATVSFRLKHVPVTQSTAPKHRKPMAVRYAEDQAKKAEDVYSSDHDEFLNPKR